MLNEKERQEIAAEAAHCPAKQAASIEALKIVQRHRGWVSDAALRDVSEMLGMTVEELDNVATFYNMIFRRPVGKHVILLCDGVTCWMVGGDFLKDHISKRLGIGMGETTADGRFTMLPAVCLGCCDRAPAMMIDEDLHTELTPEKIEKVLELYT